MQTGEKITLLSGKTIEIQKLLGKGGQGEVYEVTESGKSYALKWYLPSYLKQIKPNIFYENLLRNVRAQSPNEQFLWMLDLSEYKEDSFGYLMNLRPKNYEPFTAYLNSKVKVTSPKLQLLIAKNICKAFRSLHSKGYSYQDINDGNFFFDPKTGDVLICDNDNVAPCGEWMGIAGKDRYMAPEVVKNARENHPGMESDLFSLAVVLFMLFFIAHPLEGQQVHQCPCLTTKYLRYFYAEHPVFVYDPKDASNRPLRGIDNNVMTLWPLYPQKLKELFIRSFTKGLKDVSYRVRESEWIDCFDSLQDEIFVCPNCGGEQFYERKEDEKDFFLCGDCNKKVRKPFIWVDKSHKKLLYPGVVLYESHTENGSDKIEAAKIIKSKKNSGIWGLCNFSESGITASYSNNQSITARKEEVLPLFSNTSLKIGEKEVKIIV